MIFLIFLALVTGGWVFLPQKIDPRLQGFVEEYVEDANDYGYDITLRDIGRVGIVPHLGYAIYQGDFRPVAGVGLPPHVFLSQNSINGHTDNDIKQLVYHELTHSVFGCLGHVDSEDSVMHSSKSLPHMGEREIHKLFNYDILVMTCLRR